MNPERPGKNVISYSRNVTIPLTDICRNECSYCGFRKDPEKGRLLSEKEVLELAEKGKEAGCSEALFTLGEKPENHREAREKLNEMGHDTTVDYLEHLCEQVLDLGLLPHTNAGVLDPDELDRLARYNASMGLMLETTAELPAHENSPGKDPEKRIETIRSAGELKIPFTTGILVGIGESHGDRIKSLMEIAELQEKHGHVQEVIIQPFVPKPGTPMEREEPPDPSELKSTVLTAEMILPDTSVQVPPNLVPELSDFLTLGVDDLGGISPVTPDYVNPDEPWPEVEELGAEVEESGHELRERLPIYPEYARDPEFMSEEVAGLVEELSDEEGYRA